jgi:hypothetical protein
VKQSDRSTAEIMTSDAKHFQPPLRVVGKDGSQIHTLEDWERQGGPAGGDRQWKDGRSAKELARAWTRGAAPAPPDELVELLRADEATRGMSFGLVEPEKELKLDDFRGRTRNADLVVHGIARSHRVLLTIEAKADETFGQTLADELKRSPEGSNKPKRISQLFERLFGRELVGDDQLLHLRYQLLHGLSATLLEAERLAANTGVFIVHVFEGAADREKMAANWRDFDEFVAALSAEPTPGKLAGVPPQTWDSSSPERLLIGKLRSD